MDPLLYFVIAIFWAISSWILRRNEEKAAAEQEQEPWFPEDASARSSDRSPDRGKPVAANGWEEELRRLLEGKAPEPKPAPAPARAPESPAQPVAPPPLPAAPVASFSLPAPSEPSRQSFGAVTAAPKLVSDIDGDFFHKGLCVHCGGRLLFSDGAVGHTLNCPHCSADTPLRPSEALSERYVAASAYQRRRPTGGSMAAEVAGMFAERGTAQQAVIASVVFGPPKALQEDQGSGLF